jgi:hypothetical protein
MDRRSVSPFAQNKERNESCAAFSEVQIKLGPLFHDLFNESCLNYMLYNIAWEDSWKLWIMMDLVGSGRDLF